MELLRSWILGVTVTVGDVFMDVAHVYPDLTVHLTLYHAAIVTGEPKLLEHVALRWITPGEIDDFPFCPADREILARIRENCIDNDFIVWKRERLYHKK